MRRRRFAIDWFMLRRANRELVEATFGVARVAQDPTACNKAARAVVERFGSDCLKVRRRLLKYPPCPPELNVGTIAAGMAWRCSWQWSILEILYCVGEPAAVSIRQIAFDHYGSPQGGAMGVLCRWWLDGWEPKTTVDLVGNRISVMERDTIETLVFYLEWQSPSDPRLMRVIEMFNHVPEFKAVRQEWLAGESADPR